MRLFFILALFLIQSTPSFAAVSIVCQIEGTDAVAYYCNNPGGGSIGGTVYLQTYRKDGSTEDSDFCLGSASAVNECTELCRVSASSESAFCTARIKK